MEVGEVDLVDLDQAERALQLALGPFAAVEHQPLAAAGDQHARGRAPRRGHRAAGAEKDRPRDPWVASLRDRALNPRLDWPLAPVAQLDRALPSGGRGHRFESCRARPRADAMTALPATQILKGATIRTMDRGLPLADAVALRGNAIVAVGSLSTVRAVAGEGALEIDLGGGALLPGFIDAHHHYSYAVLDHGSPELRLAPGSSIGDLLALIEESVASKPAGWVYLCGYEASDLRERRAPRAHELEECCPGQPLFVQAANGHQGVVEPERPGGPGLGRQHPRSRERRDRPPPRPSHR